MSQRDVDTLVGKNNETSIVTGTPAPVKPLLISGANGLPFGLTSIGLPVSLPLTIINAGNDIASVSTISVSASSGLASAISFSSDTCSGSVILAGQSCTVTANFSPGASGSFAGVVSINYTGTAATPYSLLLGYTGSGSPAQPAVSSAPASWDFGTIATASTASKTFTISNSSPGNAVFQAATISGIGYTITSDTCASTTQTSSTTCGITVQFAPALPGATLGVLTLNYQNLTGTPLTKTVSVSGIGNVPQPLLTLSPSPHNFNNVGTNAFGSQVISVSNNTSVSATIGTPTISGAGYSIAGSTCNSIVLSASANCSITVRFTPSALGAVAGTLTVPYTSAQGVAYTATDTLGGTGVTPTTAFAFSGFTGAAGTDSTGLTATGVTLQWTAQTAASYYRVTQTGGAGGTVTSSHLYPTSIATFNVTGLLPNNTYQFKVNAYDLGDVSDGNNNWVTITTPNVAGSTFNGWSDVVATGSVYTDIGTVDNTIGNTGANRMERNLAVISGFDNSSVNIGTSVVQTTWSYDTGEGLKFHTDGSAPAGLTNDTVYYAINVDSTHVKLASSYANAMSNTPVTLTTVGSGNMVLMPQAIVKLAWELFSFTPSGSAASYNIYRSTAFAGPFTLIGTSTTNVFNDYQASDQTPYYYKVHPVAGSEVTAATSSDSVIKVYVPPQNMSLVHRWIANREACTNLLGFSWPAGVNRNDQYSCAYSWGTGFAPNTTYDKSKWDVGYSLVVDRWQNGCKMKNYGAAAPTGGSNGDVYLQQGTSTTAGSNTLKCYIKDVTNGWQPETSTLLSASVRASMRTNYPGYNSAPINQDQAYSSCQQRTPPGLIDGNGSSKLRLIRQYEMTIARAAQGININKRTVTDLFNTYSSINIPVNGSCNSQLRNVLNSGTVFDGVTVPNVSTYSKGYDLLMNGSSLTRNCYTRYEISNLWDNAFEWTSSQFSSTPSAGSGLFLASSLDANDNLMENYAMNGVMGTSNNVQQTNGMFETSNSSNPVMPLIGVRAVSASGTLGSRAVDFSKFDYGQTPNYNMMQYSISNVVNGIATGSATYTYTSTSRYQYGFQSGTTSGYNENNSTIPITSRCVGESP